VLCAQQGYEEEPKASLPAVAAALLGNCGASTLRTCQNLSIDPAFPSDGMI
jgi:hypothetical protein